MSANARLTLVNHWTTATITGSSTVAVHPLSNVAMPSRPFLTARTTGITQSEIIADHATAKSVQMIVLHNVNFTLAHFQAHTANTWAAPTVTSGPQAIRRDPFTRRYNLAFVFEPGFSLRWNRLLIPAQTPIATPFDGFDIGGITAGPLVEIPSSWEFPSTEYEVVDPRLDVDAELGQWSNSYRVGDRFLRITAVRRAMVLQSANPTGYADGDELEDWLDVDSAWRDAGAGAFFLNAGSSAHAWIMRLKSYDPWRLDYPKTASRYLLEEVIAG
jgi:hypothetical protein